MNKHESSHSNEEQMPHEDTQSFVSEVDHQAIITTQFQELIQKEAFWNAVRNGEVQIEVSPSYENIEKIKISRGGKIDFYEDIKAMRDIQEKVRSEAKNLNIE